MLRVITREFRRDYEHHQDQILLRKRHYLRQPKDQSMEILTKIAKKQAPFHKLKLKWSKQLRLSRSRKTNARWSEIASAKSSSNNSYSSKSLVHRFANSRLDQGKNRLVIKASCKRVSTCQVTKSRALPCLTLRRARKKNKKSRSLSKDLSMLTARSESWQSETSLSPLLTRL